MRSSSLSLSILPASVMCTLSVSSMVMADDRSVGYNFDPPLAVGLPQTGEWTTVEKWGPTICLQYDDEGHCSQKGYPGQAQPADATEYVFYKVSIAGTAPFSSTTMDMNIMASVAEVKVASNTTLSVGGQLGLNWWAVPIVTPALEWKRAILENDGQVDVTGMIYSNGKMDVTGSGTVSLLGGTIRADDLSNSTRIEGGGSITRIGSIETLAFSNSGVIDANLNGMPLTLDALPGTRTLYNAGYFRASNGGELRIRVNGASSPIGVIQNAGGTIEALDGSRVELFGLDIRNGTLSTAGNGRIEVAGRNVAVQTVTNEGLLNVNNGQQLTLAGSITNNGTIRLDAATSNTELFISGLAADNFSIGGTGVLELGHATRSVIRSIGPGLVNSTGHNIRGTGMVQGVKRFANWGLVDADVAASALKITSVNAGAITNTGVMRARNGATLDITGVDAYNPVSFNNSGGVIQAQDGSLVQLSYMTLTGGTLTTTGSGVIRLPTSVTAIGGLENLGMLDIRGSTTVLGGTLTNQGSMLLGAGSNAASLNISPGVVLVGGGTLTLSNSSSNSIASAGVGTGTLTNETGHTIQGAGKIGSYGMTLVNRGLIQANQSNALVLADSGVAANVVNEGTLRAAAGSTLQVRQNLGNFDGGTRTLTGGRYEAMGTLRLPVAGGIVRNGADIVLDGAASRLYDGNDGTTDALSGFTTNLVTGRFEVRNGRSFALGLFDNAGNIEVGAGSTLTATTYTQTAGITDVDGTLLVAGDIILNGGVFTGSGTVAGSLLNNGSLAPGNSPGILSLTGNYTQPAGTLEIEIGNLAWDQLMVSGTATLGGALNVSLWSAPGDPLFVPSPGQQFDLLLAGVVSGKFGSVNLPTVAGIVWDLQYLADAAGTTDIVRLSASPVPLPPTLWLAATAFAATILRARRRTGAA